jgi:thymidylate synthase
MLIIIFLNYKRLSKYNIIMNIELQYLELLKDILENGCSKGDRTGTGTISVFGRQIRHKMSEGFPLLTTKKMYFKGVITELLWFLRGDTNIKYLLDNDCHIWDGDAFKNFMTKSEGDPDLIWNKEQFILKVKNEKDFGKKWGELGSVYGKQWRSWEKYGYRGVQNGAVDCGLISYEDYKKEMHIDQISNLISELKTNPDSRRLMVNAWNVGELDQMVLPPCHYGFQVYTRELSTSERIEYYSKHYIKEDETMSFDDLLKVIYDKGNIPTRAISLMYNTRSQDVPLGTPFNIASYALLLEILGKMVNMVPDELISNMGDCHIYLNQVDGIKEQLEREPYKLPKLIHTKSDDFYKSLSEDLSLITELQNTDFKLEGYMSHPTIKMPLSN